MAKERQGKLGQIARGILAGAACGVVLGMALIRAIHVGDLMQRGGVEFAITYGLVIVSLFVAVFVQLIIHEGGHLVFGLASGYRFSSFRVGSLMVLRSDGRLSLKRISVPGTAGQCLLVPPTNLGEPFPCILYNLGGIIANLVGSLVCWLLLPLAEGRPVVTGFLVSMVGLGVVFALTNGIPSEVSGVPNDGWNALHLKDDELARRSFWTQLMVNARLTEGERLKDMPSEWFVVPTDDQMRNTFSAGLGVTAETRLMDQHDFAATERLIDRLTADGAGTPGVFLPTLACDRLFCELLRVGAEADTSVLDDEQVGTAFKQMGNYPSVLRTRYAIALLAQGDVTEAAKVCERFDKVSASYPAPAEVESERELMGLVDEAFSERQGA